MDYSLESWNQYENEILEFYNLIISYENIMDKENKPEIIYS